MSRRFVAMSRREETRMWEQSKRDRFQWLRDREEAGTLHDTEKQELQGLIQEIEDAEAEYLAPATERMSQERKTIEAQNQALEALATRKEALLARLKAVVEEVNAERQAIDEEVARILAADGQGQTGQTG
jgi:hypothetical protein